jgi:hypothetical protein
MGAAVSVDECKHVLNQKAANKPLDASDIYELNQAKMEIAELRKVAQLYRNKLSGPCLVPCRGSVSWSWSWTICLILDNCCASLSVLLWF